MGPMEIFRRLVSGSGVLEGALDLTLPIGLVLSTAFMRELAVVATDTGWRGRDDRSGGDSFGGGFAMYAWRRVLLLGVGSPGGGPFRPVADCVGVLALEVGVLEREVGVVALDVLPFAPGRFTFAGEFERVESGLVESPGVLSFRIDSGNFDAVC